MIKQLLKSLNNTLINYKLSLDETQVALEFGQIDGTWNVIASQITKPVKYLIIGEATVSYKNYFYNPESAITSFLTPRHFNCGTKGDLIELFQNEGVLVFDLYPLPLPTFIYDNVKFDCSNTTYIDLLNEYFESKLNGLIDKNTKVVLRYIKLMERCEWQLLVDYLTRQGVTIIKVDHQITINNIATVIQVPLNISRSTSADREKIIEIFEPIIL
jgi:hypothetical protein